MEKYNITEEWDGSRLDRFIKAALPELSFARIQVLARKGLIKLNGRKVKGSVRLKTSDTVTIYVDKVETASEKHDVKWRIGSDIAVLYEDDELMVIDKPAGLPVQPGNRSERGSILDVLRLYQAEKEQWESRRAGKITFPYSPVHRLDTETTGALLVAKTRRAARTLSKALREGRVKKIYLAVVSPAPNERSGVITTPIMVEKGIRSKAVVARGKGRGGKDSQPEGRGKENSYSAGRKNKNAPSRNAKTFYTVKKRRRDGSAVLELRIETGRTHQIRAHLASIGSPILGDRRYGAKRQGHGNEQIRGPLHLHSWQLVFRHPTSGEPVRVKAPVPW